MATVSIVRGQCDYTNPFPFLFDNEGDEEFEELCFDFGIELDEVVGLTRIALFSDFFVCVAPDVRETDADPRARSRESKQCLRCCHLQNRSSCQQASLTVELVDICHTCYCMQV